MSFSHQWALSLRPIVPVCKYSATLLRQNIMNMFAIKRLPAIMKSYEKNVKGKKYCPVGLRVLGCACGSRPTGQYFFTGCSAPRKCTLIVSGSSAAPAEVARPDSTFCMGCFAPRKCTLADLSPRLRLRKSSDRTVLFYRVLRTAVMYFDRLRVLGFACGSRPADRYFFMSAPHLGNLL